jgi:hypothetical protein
MAETSAKREAVSVDGHLGAGEAIEELAELDVETVLEDELEIARDASPDRLEARQDGAELDIPPPRYGTRGEAPGPRGCWAINRAGEPCGAAKRGDSDYCNAHSGHGVARDPLAYSSEGHEARRRNLETRARMRLLLGNTRPDTPRGALKAATLIHAERIAGRAVSAVLDESADPIKAGSLALRLIETVDPPSQAVLELDASLRPEDVQKLSYSELIRVAEAFGITASDPPETSVHGSHGLPQPSENG